MEHIPPWLVSAFRKRIDELDYQLQLNHTNRQKRKWNSSLFERLRQSYTEEQMRMYMEWEEQLTSQMAHEKERLYVSGFADGFHMYASLETESASRNYEVAKEEAELNV